MKTKQDCFSAIAEEVKKANQILLVTHIHMDGDALGSAAALCRTLRRMGKESWILIEDEIPQNLCFLDQDYCTTDDSIMEHPDLCICLDCSEEKRFPKRAEAFSRGAVSVCIDHHATGEPICDFNHINPEAAATGELVYQLIQELGVSMDQETAEALFAAITTDTGNFQYSNTRKLTHEIVSSLYDAGIDANKVSVEIYESNRPERLILEGKILNTLAFDCDGKIASAVVSRKMLEECGAKMEECEGVVAELRSIAGVEIAILLKEYKRTEIKASLRAKGDADVAEICSFFDGGGHKKASGCTLHCTLPEARSLIRSKAIESIEKYGI